MYHYSDVHYVLAATSNKIFITSVDPRRKATTKKNILIDVHQNVT